MTTDFITSNTSNLSLTHTQYFGFESQGHSSPLLSATTAVAIAVSSFVYGIDSEVTTEVNIKAKSYSKPLLAQAQKCAVRKLLFQLIFVKMQNWVFTYTQTNEVNLLRINGLRLLENSYPYRLLPFNYYVCFTHSANKIACAIHSDKVIGIDLEANPVSMKVAERYYTPQEKHWLSQLDPDSLPQALKLLWMLKEASIKHSAASSPHLLSGLKEDKLIAAQKLLSVFTKERDIKSSKQVYYYQDLANLKNSTTYVYIAAESLVAIW